MNLELKEEVDTGHGAEGGILAPVGDMARDEAIDRRKGLDLTSGDDVERIPMEVLHDLDQLVIW
jgi:hypothetical protein